MSIILITIGNFFFSVPKLNIDMNIAYFRLYCFPRAAITNFDDVMWYLKWWRAGNLKVKIGDIDIHFFHFLLKEFTFRLHFQQFNVNLL